MQKLLNFQFNELKQAINKPTLVFIHGLFGDMNNLGIIAAHLVKIMPFYG